MNERIELASAIEARKNATAAREQAQDALDRAGEYLRMVEDETAGLQARNQSEIAAHGRNLIESFRAGGQGAALAETSTAIQLAEAQRKFEAAGAAYGELERELAQTCAAETAAQSRVRNAAAAVLHSESDDIAKQVRDAEKRAGELREQLRAMGAISSGVVPGEKLRFLSPEAVDALSWPGKEPFVPRSVLLENTATWRAHFDALVVDAGHLLRS
jgi:hypothetical protein